MSTKGNYIADRYEILDKIGTGGMSVNERSNNTFTQWGVQAINNAYQRTANAIAKNIKKNKAKLKYGTFVYLVNSQEKKN